MKIQGLVEDLKANPCDGLAALCTEVPAGPSGLGKDPGGFKLI